MLALVAAVLLAPPSASKLGVHLLGGTYSEGARRIVAARPRLLKVFDVGADTAEALRDYRRRVRGGTTVLRVWFQRRWTREQDPEISAREMWAEVLAPKLSQLPEDARRLIDYVEGPNEGDSTPTWATVEDARWYGRFCAALAGHISRGGYRPCVGNIPVGNPGGEPAEIAQKMEAFLPALEAARKARGAWSYHAYTIDYSTDEAKERYYSLRYRQLHAVIRQKSPGLARLPLLLTEGGVDFSGNREKDGWQQRGTAKRYLEWLAWFDAELRKDPYVVGVTLFQIGDAYWSSFNLEPIAGELAAYLERA